MEAVQDTTPLQAAIRWLLQTILPSLLVGGKLDGWIRQAGLGGEVEGLRDEIEQVDGVVSAMNSRSEIRNRSLARSLAALKELLYDAGDLVDELDCYRLQRQLHGGPWHWHHPNEADGQTSLSTGDSIQNASADDSSRRKRRRGDDSTDQTTAANTGPWNKDQISKRIQNITGQLQDIRGNVRRVLKMLGPGSRAGQNRCRGTTTSDPRRSTSSLVQGKVYGRAEEKSHVIELIKESKSDAGVTVLPIVGIAGVGKTTLAQLVYNDPDLESQFDLRIWIWVSSSFDETRVTREMLDFVSHGTREGQCKLQEVLKGHVKSKRVLLILDDIWDDVTDCQWNQLLAPFKTDNAKGNMILLTTRKPSLAKKRGTTRPVNLHGLKNGDFWLMFKACAFGDENYEEQVSLGELGQQIAKRLQGNPLAAETAGTLLREHLTVDHWNNILKNEDWKSLQLSSGIMSALKLCYDQLPYSLQQCFSYCSIFPYGYHFLAEELVRMWISQGFVKCNHSSMILEEGRYYLCDLVNLGFFEQFEGKELPSGRTQNYAMCGLMHDLARVVSNTECGAMDGLRYNEMLPTIHHLSIVTDGQTGNIPGSEKFERKLQSIFTSVAKLRTFVLTGQYESSFFEEVFQKAYSLRVLQISATSADFHSFRYSLVNLIHLRYLNLDGYVEQGSCSPQVHLYDDSAVQENAALPALQKVRLENCGEKQAILSLEKLPFLTTLKLTNMWGVRELLVPLLEELVLVNMPGLERCSCTSLGDLVSSLRVLEIRKCSALKVFHMFEKAPETRLKPLDSLQLHSCTSLEDLRIEECRWITAVEGLDLVKLKHLNVWKNSRLHGISGKGYFLQSQLDGLIINDLCVLTTSICKGLTCLQHLTIQSLECEAKRLTDDQERALLLHKSLQDLLFDGCEYLVHLPAGLHSLPALKKLTIISCSRILRLPKEEVPPSLEELVIEDCSVELSEQCRLLETSKLKTKLMDSNGALKMLTDIAMMDRIENSSSITQPEETVREIEMDSSDIQKNYNDEGSEEAKSAEGGGNSPGFIKQNDVQTVIAHNKPKKANINVIPEDYICTPRDITVIESIRSAPKKTKFVDIGDALLSNDELECLIKDDMFLHDGVINAYIYCMLAHDHLRDRVGEKVHIISTFLSAQIKIDGEKDIDPSKYRHIVQQVNNFLQQDMLFLPINIPRTHWYLSVVNAKKHEIQVLNSLGARVKRSDLVTTLRGLEKRLKLVEQSSEFNRDHKWPDLNVTKWTIVEQFQEAMQTDGVSCGLFMLNYMEYWLRDVLSDRFTQEDMKHFRQKLAVILLDSDLNQLKGNPIYYQSDDEKSLHNSDVEFLDDPLNRVEDKRPTPIPVMPMDQHELIIELCNYITSIDDAKCLEKEWVRNSTPYPMGLSLKTIQGILNKEKPMDNDCFNMAVRLLGCDESLVFVDPPEHYMDLRFCTTILDLRDRKFCDKTTIQMLATLFDSPPDNDYNISSCNMIYLPYASIGRYMLYVIDKHARRVNILDPILISQSPEVKNLRHLVKLQRFAREFNDALEIKQHGWNSDISKWQRVFPPGIPTSMDGDASGYFVFYFMLWWNGKKLVRPVIMDGYELRIQFLLYLLKHYMNEAKENFPDIVRDFFKRIK